MVVVQVGADHGGWSLDQTRLIGLAQTIMQGTLEGSKKQWYGHVTRSTGLVKTIL